MDLPSFAPRRKIDHYIHQTRDIMPLYNLILKIANQPKKVPKNDTPEKSRKNESPEKNRRKDSKNERNDDILAVLHGIGLEGCSAVATILARLKHSGESESNNFSLSEPLIELWEGLPTFHAYILRNKGAK